MTKLVFNTPRLTHHMPTRSKKTSQIKPYSSRAQKSPLHASRLPTTKKSPPQNHQLAGAIRQLIIEHDLEKTTVRENDDVECLFKSKTPRSTYTSFIPTILLSSHELLRLRFCETIEQK